VYATYSILIRSSFDKARLFQAFLLLFFFSNTTTAQVIQTSRYEIPLLQDERFEIIPANDFGLYLYRFYPGFNENDQVQIVRLDTALNEKWSGLLPVPRNYNLIGKRALDRKLFLIYRYRDYTRNNLLLYVVHEEAGIFNQYEIKSYIPFSPAEFQVTGNSILLGGYFNRVPLVLHFSTATGKSKVLPGMFNEAGELTQIRTYDDGTFDVLISAINARRQKTIWIKNYDPDGNLYRQFALDPGDKHLIFGRSLKLDNNQQVVAGVYGTHRGTEFSRGIFVSSIDPSGLENTRYYNFGDLDNFFKYMRVRREQRVKDRIERRKVKGKKIRFNYRFLVHEIVPYKGQYILLGEAFYPRYHNYDRLYGSGFFSPTNSSSSIIRGGRIFEGYYYTHAVVMGFDENGKLLWDNSFEINDVKTMTLEQFVKLEVLEDKIALMYLFENKIRTKIIKDNEVLEGKSVDPLRTLRSSDVVRKENVDASNKLEYWYSDYLYAYGVQDIVNAAVREKKRVFFINKVTYAD
jgi:hypothetical protein